MKYFVLSLAIAGFLLFTIPYVSAELYDDKGNQKYKFTDTDGNQFNVYQTGQKIKFSQEIQNNRNYTLIGDTEIKVDGNIGKFSKIILSQKFKLSVGEVIGASAEWTPEQSGFYRMYVIANYNNPPGATEGFLTHEEGSGNITVVDKFSKAYSENHQCREDYFPVAKPNYSNLNCVTNDTLDSLKQREWHSVILSE